MPIRRHTRGQPTSIADLPGGPFVRCLIRLEDFNSPAKSRAQKKERRGSWLVTGVKPPNQSSGNNSSMVLLPEVSQTECACCLLCQPGVAHVCCPPMSCLLLEVFRSGAKHEPAAELRLGSLDLVCIPTFLTFNASKRSSYARPADVT